MNTMKNNSQNAVMEIVANYIHTNKVKQYCHIDSRYKVFEKVFNRGMGAITFAKFYEDENIVCVNSTFCRASDKKHIQNIINLLGDNWKIEYREYGYPTYYNQSFGLKLPK